MIPGDLIRHLETVHAGLVMGLAHEGFMGSSVKPATAVDCTYHWKSVVLRESAIEKNSVSITSSCFPRWFRRSKYRTENFGLRAVGFALAASIRSTLKDSNWVTMVEVWPNPSQLGPELLKFVCVDSGVALRACYTADPDSGEHFVVFDVMFR